MKAFAVLFVAICLANTISGYVPDCTQLQTGDYVPDYDDCEKFYQCAHGTAVLFTCPDQLHFNVNTKQCDYKENVRCQRLITPADLCRGKEVGQLISDPYNCNAYVQCTNTRIGFELHQCDPELVFNPFINVCDHAYNFPCTPMKM